MVSSAHVILVGAIFGLTVVHGCMSPPPDTKGPMELIVEVPSDIIDLTAMPPPADVVPQVEEKKLPPEVKDDDFVTDDKTAPKKKDTPPVDKKVVQEKKPPADKKTASDKKLVKRPVKVTSNRKSKLTAAEIERLLGQGAKAGKKATLSDDALRNLAKTEMKYGDGDPVTMEAAYFELIRQTLYRVWNQPSSIGVAGLVTRVELTMTPDGSIADSRIVSGSGNPVMDASVSKALKTVRRVSGLPPGFLSSHRRITVAFELTGDG